jgi:hypothetical protein
MPINSLLKEISNDLSNCDAITLHVKADNTSAIQFYLKHGFKKASYLTDYYHIDGKTYDAVFMKKTLHAEDRDSVCRVMHRWWMKVFLSLCAVAVFIKSAFGFSTVDDDTEQVLTV